MRTAFVLVAASIWLGGVSADAQAKPLRAVAWKAGPCKATETRRVVSLFVAAWTRGETAAAERLVAPEPQFRWLSVGPPGSRSGPSAFKRDSLRTYLKQRRAMHDRLQLTKFKFNGSDVRVSDGFGHFEFEVARDADDWPPGIPRTRPGKGAIVCTLARPMLAVLSLG
jgi:hypothetical protein